MAQQKVGLTVPAMASQKAVGIVEMLVDFKLATLWISRPDNPYLLAPISTVSEFITQVPIVARGYLNNPVRTAAVFIGCLPGLRAQISSYLRRHIGLGILLSILKMVQSSSLD